MEVSRRSRGLSKSLAPGRFCVPAIQDDTLKVKAVTARLPILPGHTRSASMSVGKSAWQQKAGGAAGALTTVWFQDGWTRWRSFFLIYFLDHFMKKTFAWNEVKKSSPSAKCKGLLQLSVNSICGYFHLRKKIKNKMENNLQRAWPPILATKKQQNKHPIFFAVTVEKISTRT